MYILIECIVCSVLVIIVYIYWWKRKKGILHQLTAFHPVVNLKDFDRILNESKVQLEKLELGFVQLQNKNQELDNIKKLNISEIKKIKQEIESTKTNYTVLLTQQEPSVEISTYSIKEKNDSLSKSLSARELELSNAKVEIQKLKEELKRMRDTSYENGADHQNHKIIDQRHSENAGYDDEDEIDESEDEIELWSTQDPKKIFTESYLYESGGACVGGIWLAKDNRTHKQVVIKKIQADKDDRARYVHDIAKQEISITKHLQKHGNIVDFYDAFVIEKGKEYWLVIEYMDSKTLFDIVTNYNYMCSVFPTEPQLARISVEILKGLSYMHTKHFLHKDIKSENILFNTNFQIKLADFGNSTHVDEETGKAEPQEAVGTCYWMAPEIINEEEHDGKVDVWSFGIVLYEMITGLPPYNDVKESEEVKSLIVKYDIPSPWKPTDTWSKEIRSFYHRCVIKEPTKRATTEELLKHPFCTHNVAHISQVYELMEAVSNFNDDEETEEEDTL